MTQRTFDDLLNKVLDEQLKEKNLSLIADNVPNVLGTYYPEKSHLTVLQESIREFHKNKTSGNAAKLTRVIEAVFEGIQHLECDKTIRSKQLKLLDHIQSFISPDIARLAKNNTRQLQQDAHR